MYLKYIWELINYLCFTVTDTNYVQYFKVNAMYANKNYGLSNLIIKNKY